MPRAEFNKLAELKKWLRTMVERNRKYIMFYTDNEEFVVQPTTSTAPVTYGYASKMKYEQAEEMALQWDIPLIRVKRFEWSSENQVKKE